MHQGGNSALRADLKAGYVSLILVDALVMSPFCSPGPVSSSEQVAAEHTDVAKKKPLQFVSQCVLLLSYYREKAHLYHCDH